MNHAPRDKKSLAVLLARKGVRPITMLTCYDFPTACLEERAGVDIVFVGDSVGTNVLGYQSERDVTVGDMVHHIRAVRRGVATAYLLADLPYRSYDTPAAALANASRLLEAGADGVKLEGGIEQQETVRRLGEVGIDVCGHIGYTPQTLGEAGKRARVQGRSFGEARALIQGALTLEQAGAKLLVLELIPSELAKIITSRLGIPTIGIGAGPFCDGQVLVVHDVLGMTPLRLRFAKRYVDLSERALEAITQFRDDVERGLFPSEEHGFAMEEKERRALEHWATVELS